MRTGRNLLSFLVVQNSRAERPIEVFRHLAMRQPHGVCCNPKLCDTSGMFPDIQENSDIAQKAQGLKGQGVYSNNLCGLMTKDQITMRASQQATTWVHCKGVGHRSTSNPASWHHIIPPNLKSKNKKIINAGQGVEKRECSYTVGGNVNWCSHYGKQYGGSLKN